MGFRLDAMYGRRRRHAISARPLAVAATALLVCATAATPTTTDPLGPVLTIIIDGGGEVGIAPLGTSCDSDCSERVEAGAEVTLTATQDPGWIFARWGGACAGADGDTCALSADGDLTVEVAFALAGPPPVSTSPPVTGTTPTTTPDTTPTTTSPTTTDESPPLPTLPPVSEDLLLLGVKHVLGSSLGSVAFNTPKTMGIGESADIQLLLSLQKPVERLKQEIEELGDRQGARVRVSDEMIAQLAGDGFDITQIGPAQQVVLEDEDTRWKWVVTPRRTGSLRLFLTLTALVDVKGERRQREIRTFERTLIVQVTWHERLSHFLQGNWQWLWGAVFVPFVLWAIRSRRRPHAHGHS